MINIFNLTNGDKLWLLGVFLSAKELNLREKDKTDSLSFLQF